MSTPVRIHAKNSAEVLAFLQRNEKTFHVEKTSVGMPTFNYENISVYSREKVINRGALNKIMMFQNQVSKSKVYEYLNTLSQDEVAKESEIIESTILYKSFLFNPFDEDKFDQVVKIDLNSAYWQTCRYFNIINGDTYRLIMRKCTKPTRLRITGTLGKKVIITRYIKGIKIDSDIKKERKRRIIFQNIYNRIRKFVDELMLWCWQKNPSNFIGYFVDCIWLREYDQEVIDALKLIYKLKIELVDLYVQKNKHNKMVVVEVDAEGDKKPYDAQFKHNKFVIYKNLYNFTPDLKNINIKTKW